MLFLSMKASLSHASPCRTLLHPVLPRKAGRVFLSPMHHFNIPTDRDLALQVRELILADLSRYDTIPQLAQRAGTNPYKLKLVFKKQFGISLFQFSRQQRISLAKQLLRDTNYPLQPIAELTGYSEGNNFQASFKQVEGCTPGTWRRRQYEADEMMRRYPY